MRLNDKVAIVTGACSGIGRATAACFALQGARVVLADIDAQQGQLVEADIRQKGGRSLYVQTDVSVRSDVRSMVEAAVDAYGRVDVLVNSAGKAIPGNAIEISEDDWDRCLAVNLKGAWLCCREVIAQMPVGGGSIINIASTHPLRAQSNYFPYAVAKGGMLAMTASLSVDFGPRGIRVNSICPGFIETPMNDAALAQLSQSPQKLQFFLAAHPLRRLGQADDIAYACVYLASDEARFVTGTTVIVDGGRTVYGHYLHDA